jgi:hypothetical protein
MDEKDTHGRARELAQARYSLRWHVVTYVLVNVGLLFTWWNTGRGFFWPALPIFFWGIGVVVHYLRAYRTGGHGWIDEETERILREREDESGES